jgi:hypothetical protein
MAVDLFIAASALGVAGSVTAAFWKYEDVASPEAKQAVASWLKYRGSDSISSRWADQLVTAFNRIFGERHLSLTCFLRSCLASLIAVSTMCLVWRTLRPEEFAEFYDAFVSYPLIGWPTSKMFMLLIIFGFNLIPDYFSYMKSRMILKAMSGSESGLSRLWQFAILDTFLTATIFCLLWQASWVSLFLVGHVKAISLSPVVISRCTSIVCEALASLPASPARALPRSVGYYRPKRNKPN